MSNRIGVQDHENFLLEKQGPVEPSFLAEQSASSQEGTLGRHNGSFYLEGGVQMIGYDEEGFVEDRNGWLLIGAFVAVVMFWLFVIFGIVLVPKVHADQILQASWYSEASLKKEGTWKKSKGVMANGKKFDETKLTVASRIHPRGSVIKIVNISNGKSVLVIVTDRIGKRFAKTRIDLSRAAFQKIASLKEGLVKVEVSQ
jgi:rare lipoprotein A